MIHQTAGTTLLEFQKVSQGPRTAHVRPEWSASLSAALLDGKGWNAVERGGRGEVYLFDFEGGRGVLRRYRRGGIIRHLLKDRYFLSNRPLRELRVHTFLYERGFPVPEPLGACWERSGPWFRGTLATRQVPGAGLVAWLPAHPEAAYDLLSAVGGLIRRMHDLGVIHADLHVGNILIGDEGAYLIDFDNARLVELPTRVQRARNLLRLRRSLRTNGLPAGFFEPIRAGYGLDTLPRWLDRLYAIKGALSDALIRPRSGHDTRGK